ncbi:CPCC family cysteine-rich protein [Streptomyces sp. NPDC048845]|uniref:CPCC family cysteine-rich protein n=1 Tax=Streptomyces sp. NPDC048845 TaxID=3155390 RepID=UPI00343684E3
MILPGASRDPYSSIDAAVGSSLEAEAGDSDAWDTALGGEAYRTGTSGTVAVSAGGASPCPCCGHLTLGETGGYEICPVCCWEDDPVQLRWPLMESGANELCLMDAQLNYRRTGAAAERFRGRVRPPAAHERRDPGWRPVDLAKDSFEAADTEVPWPEDLALLYWWRPAFWRRGA